MTFAANVDRAVAAGICHFLANGGNAGFTQVLVGAALTPGGQVPALAAGLGLLALNYGCSFDPNKTVPTTSTAFRGCTKTATGTMTVGYKMASGEFYAVANDVAEVLYWTFSRYSSGGVPIWSYKFRRANGTTSEQIDGALANALYPTSTLNAGASCAATTPAPAPTDKDLTFRWTDTECSMDVTLLGYAQQADNGVAPILKISSATTTYATGGVISGCNFNPFIVVPPPGGGGGGPRIPWLPGPDGPGGQPWWAPLVAGALQGLASAAVQALIRSLLPETLPATVYRLTSVCETDANGEAIDQSVDAVIPQLPFGQAVDARLGALVDIAQGLKDFRQPTCSKCFKPVGEFVTIHFVSEEPAGATGNPLSKLFRYRDQAGSTLEDTVNHWEAFSWRSGPVMVVSSGLSWGVPKVWAATAEEGRRVIRHAATIAGVDLDSPDHKWIISASSDPRIGRAGTMRVRVSRGILQVSKRPGPSGPPLKGKFIPAS